MRCTSSTSVLLLGLAAIAATGCGASVREEWARPGATPIVKLAVLPLENQTPALRAGAAATDLLVGELLATGRLAILEPTEVADLLRRENLDPGDAARLPSAQRVGRLLQVSHVLQGSVVEYRYKPGLSETPVVGLTARVIDVATGDVVWTASHARTGSSFLREDGLAQVAQGIAHDIAAHLTGALGGR